MKDEMLKEITLGDVNANAFVIAFLKYVHLMDDIVDEPGSVSDKRLVVEQLGFIEQILMNPWVKGNIGLLWPVIVVSANSWIDSNQWEKYGSEKQKMSVATLKGQYHEVIWLVAYLCGGIEHQQRVTTKYREYDYE